MRAVVLAAGYATRLYPLTQHQAKPLLAVGGRPIIDYLLDQLRSLPIQHISVVCNAKFATQFRQWCPSDVELITNRSQHEHERLGAVGDLQLALQHIGEQQSCLVAAADNLFEVGFDGLIARSVQTNASCIAVWHNPDPADCSRRGNVEFDVSGRITRFEEKPQPAFSTWSTAPLYVYQAEDLPLVAEYLHGGGNPDAPGHFAAWLAAERSMYVDALEQPPVDIGTLDALHQARQRLG